MFALGVIWYVNNITSLQIDGASALQGESSDLCGKLSKVASDVVSKATVEKTRMTSGFTVIPGTSDGSWVFLPSNEK